MQTRKKQLVLLTACIAILLGICPEVFSHCEIPCGIYDDAMRLDMITEHIKTIQKAMIEIQELEKHEPKNNNQLVRWIVNKDHHADALSEIVTKYFMTQRIRPVDESNKEHVKYIEQLTALHQMLIYSMKCKQTTDLENVEKLKSLLAQFRKLYLGSK